MYPNAKTAADAFADRNDHYIYSRYANPTVKMFETKAATLEQAPDCIATASGMAAVFAAMMCQLKSGDEVVASDALFGSCDHIIRNILPQYGILVKRVAGGDLTQWQKAITTKTKLVFFETPANPTLDLVDIQAVSDIAHNKGAKVLVDNVFATSIFQKPMPARGGHSNILGNQAHRWARQSLRGLGARLGGVLSQSVIAVYSQHWSFAQPLQCLGATKGDGDSQTAGGKAKRNCPGGGGVSSAKPQNRQGVLPHAPPPL